MSDASGVCDICKINPIVSIYKYDTSLLDSIDALPRVRFESFNQCGDCNRSTWKICQKYIKCDIETRLLLKIYDPTPRRERLICKELKWINGINKIIAGYC